MRDVWFTGEREREGEIDCGGGSEGERLGVGSQEEEGERERERGGGGFWGNDPALMVHTRNTKSLDFFGLFFLKYQAPHYTLAAVEWQTCRV